VEPTRFPVEIQGTTQKILSTLRTTPQEKKSTVSYDTHQKLLGEKKAIAAKLAAFEAEQKARDDKALREKEDFKTLAEKRAEELKEAHGKLAKLEERNANQVKLRAILDGAGGTIDRKYWDLLPKHMVEIDDTTGMPTEASVATAVKFVRTNYAEVITPKDAKIPTGAAAMGGSTQLTYDAWKALPDAEKAKRIKDVDQATM